MAVPQQSHAALQPACKLNEMRLRRVHLPTRDDNTPMFHLQCMVAFRCGPPGGPAASAVEKASRRGVGSATTHSQPTVGGCAKGRTQKHGTVKISCVQVYFCRCLIDWSVYSLPLGCLRVGACHLNLPDGVMVLPSCSRRSLVRMEFLGRMH